jgi:hypothetical protein
VHEERINLPQIPIKINHLGIPLRGNERGKEKKGRQERAGE